MANDPEKKTAQKGNVGASTATDKSQSRVPRRRVDDAGYNYMQEVREAWREYQDDTATAQSKYSKALQDAEAGARKTALEAQESYVEAVQQARGKEDEQKRIEEALEKYQQTIREVSESAHKSTEEAYKGYTQALSGDHESAKSCRKHLEKAYRNYVKAIQQIDLSTLDPETLLVLTQNAAAVAMHAGSNSGI